MNQNRRYVRWELVLGAALLSAGIAGCHKDQSPTITDANNTGDPADANLAASDGSTPGNDSQQGPLYTSAPAQPATGRVLSARSGSSPQSQGEQYAEPQYPAQQTGAPIERRAPENSQSSNGGYDQSSGQQQAYGDNGYDQGVQDGLDAVEEADQPPPPLPVYEQPPCPDPNDLWTPGYWNYASAGYYWVPGAWVAAPYTGALWTPGYWGYYGHQYRFHHGFWGPHVGFYGGISYGFGYTGYGYQGGYWNGDRFQYNRAVNRVDTTRITNVYNRTVINNTTINNTTINRVSYNGGNGGIAARPRPAELAALRETHTPPMATQLQLRDAARSNRQQFFAANHGAPAEVVTARPISATPGIAPPAVRLPNSNATRHAVPTQGGQQAADGQRLRATAPNATQQPGNQQRGNGVQQQPGTQQRPTAPAQQQQRVQQQQQVDLQRQQQQGTQAQQQQVNRERQQQQTARGQQPQVTQQRQALQQQGNQRQAQQQQGNQQRQGNQRATAPSTAVRPTPAPVSRPEAVQTVRPQAGGNQPRSEAAQPVRPQAGANQPRSAQPAQRTAPANSGQPHGEAARPAPANQGRPH